MKFLYKIIAALTPPPAPVNKKTQEQRRKKTNSRIVSSLSKGNVLLQNGRYLTDADIKQRKAQLAGYKF